MKIKPTLGNALLALSFAVALGGTGFAQSGAVNGPEGDPSGAAHATWNEVVVAAALPNSSEPAYLRTSEAAAERTESTGTEAAEPAQKEAGRAGYSRIGIGVKFSTLGVGVEMATPLAGRFNVRGGFNMFRYSRPITDSGIHYNGQLRFQSAQTSLDWFPFGGFHVSPGLLFYNGNEVRATAMVPGGQTFSTGGVRYESDPATPVTGTGKLNFVKVSPSIMAGVGNVVPRNGRHYSFLFEVGAIYQSSARVALNLAGNVCDTTGTFCRAISSDPSVQANIQAQQAKIQKDLNPYRFYPVISTGIGFNF
jgi:hypothetical protein